MHVAVDRAQQRQGDYHPDDPQLMGREISFELAEVRSNLGQDANCKPPRWQQRSATWGFLLDHGLLRTGGETPTPEDYGLKVSPKAMVRVHSFCGIPRERLVPDAPPNEWVRQLWLVEEGRGRLLMHLNIHVVLVLVRRHPGAKPRASFACKKARTPTEKTICGSFSLAALDRSVALAYRNAQAESAADDQREDQKTWLKARDACGTDQPCLEKQMEQRIVELSDM